MLQIDTNLSYAYDCEYYYRYILKHKSPKLIDQATIVNYLWNESISSGISQDFIDKENKYILEKHGFTK
jgi:hypothetical protein